MEAKSDLQLRLVRQVLELIVDGTLKLGDPLREVELSSQFGVSRSPVRAALSQLAGLGAAARGGSRGMQVALDSGSARTTLENLPLEDEDQIREQIAKDWFEGRVPREISGVALPLNRVILNLCGAEEAFGP
jgi:DNA-binding FadR family transcriptional regulator